MTNIFSPSKPITVKDFYASHKDEILKLVATEHLQRTEIKHLKYEITSLSGRRYYSFPEKMALPFQRLSKGLEYIEWLKNGISAEDFDRIRHELTTCLAHIKANTDQSKAMTTKAGLLISEMERRRVSAVPYYVLVNLAANYLIRDDEEPQVISPVIHHEKCDDIENELNNGNNAFFLTIPQLRVLSVLQTLSVEDLTNYLAQLRAEAIHETQLLKLVTSWTDVTTKPVTSKKG